MKGFYDAFCDWLSVHPITTGGVLAIVLTGLRVAMSEDSKSFKFVCLEGVACGCLSMALSYTAIHLLNLDSSIGVFIGSTAGFIGIERTRVFMIRLLDSWLASHYGKDTDRNDTKE